MLTFFFVKKNSDFRNKFCLIMVYRLFHHYWVLLTKILLRINNNTVFITLASQSFLNQDIVHHQWERK